MSLRLERSEWFLADIEYYMAWYDREASWDVADRFLNAIDETLRGLTEMPTKGPPANFEVKELRGLRCWRVNQPFDKYLIFYQFDETSVSAERLIHGARDLPTRLTEPLGIA